MYIALKTASKILASFLQLLVLWLLSSLLAKSFCSHTRFLKRWNFLVVPVESPAALKASSKHCSVTCFGNILTQLMYLLRYCSLQSAKGISQTSSLFASTVHSVVPSFVFSAGKYRLFIVVGVVLSKLPEHPAYQQGTEECQVNDEASLSI